MKAAIGTLAVLVALAAPGVAAAQDEAASYDEQTQVDYLMNYFALGTGGALLHAPVPHEPGHGAIGVDLSILPPLAAKRKLALGGSKTEDTKQPPIVPRLRATFAFPLHEKVVPFAGFGWVPPIPLGGSSSHVLSGEIGIAGKAGESFQLGGRVHATILRSIGDVATAFEGGPLVKDFYQGEQWGLDVSAGYKIGPITPYVALGFTDVATFFWVGDDGVVTTNLHPYFGPTFVVGLDGLVIKDRFRFGAEFYGAPGGSRMPDKSYGRQKGFGHYGHMYTGRIRLAVEL